MNVQIIVYLFGKNLPTALIPWHLAPQSQLAHHDEIFAWDGHRVQEVDDAPVELGLHYLSELVVQGLAEILFKFVIPYKIDFRSIFGTIMKKYFFYLIPSLPGLLNSGFM